MSAQTGSTRRPALGVTIIEKILHRQVEGPTMHKPPLCDEMDSFLFLFPHTTESMDNLQQPPPTTATITTSSVAHAAAHSAAVPVLR